MAISALVVIVWLSSGAAERPADFVDIEEVAKGVVVEARYFGEDNFVGAKVDGYQAAKCLMTTRAADALGRVQAELGKMGLRLRIYDCYRHRSR